MSQPTRALADFLNHGILPFVGREQECARLLAFWRATTDANGLRAALISGEAGIGKSRLIEEVVPEILSGGGAIIHTKLYQESATTLVPLLAKSVWHSVAGRELLKVEPEANFESLNAALRRIASLRPTTIVIEDIQHMQSGSSRELANLLESLSHETLSLVVTMRPSAAVARSVIEQYLTEEIALEGLKPEAFVGVCAQLFEGKVETGVVEALEQASLGNALAVRSALRGALKTGFLDRRDGAVWKMSVPRDAFFRHLENNVRSLSEGMASHLDEAERVACESLAILGELFSVEAAELLLPNASAMLDRLRFKGMITTSASAHAPLAGKASSYPLLAFSHSLLHKYFYDHTHLWGDEIVRLLGEEQMSIYGIAPYLLLEQKEISAEVPSEQLFKLLKSMVTLVSKLDNSSDWELGFLVHDMLTKLFDKYRSRLSQGEDRELEFEVLRSRLTLLRRSIPHPQYKPLLDRIVELSQDVKTTADAERRLAASMCEYWYWRRMENADTVIPELRMTIDEIACAFPDVVLTRPYRILMTYLAQYASEMGSQEEALEVERRTNVMLAHPDCTEAIRKFVLGYVYPEFLSLFSTRAELEERLRLAERIEGMDDYLKASLLTSKTDLLLDTGHLSDAARVLDTSMILFREHGFRYSLYSANIKKLTVAVLLGKVIDGIVEEAKPLISLLPVAALIDEGARRIIAQRFVPTALHVGRDDVASDIVRNVMPAAQPANAEHILLLALRTNEPVETILKSTPSDKRYANVFAALRSGSREDILQSTAEILSVEILRLNDILGIALAIEISRAHSIDHGDQIPQAITNALTWLHERDLAVIMTAFLERYGDLIAEKEVKSWKQKIAKLKKKGSEPSAGSGKIVISMLGTIEYRLPDGQVERIRGARLRSVLGVMTANLMLSEPLSHKAFCAVAAGEKEDFELARKTVNMAVAGLRDDLGAEAILTSGDTPMLNLDRVQIDLLEASDLLDDATKHLRRGSIMKALADLTVVLQNALGKVPFPTLYDNLFEALRDDFDARLRKTTLDLARRLLSEGDTPSAIVRLRRFFDVIQDDDEVADLLRDALIQQGQSGEAERIRMRATEVVK